MMPKLTSPLTSNANVPVDRVLISRSPASCYAIFSYIEGWYKPARRHSGIRYSPMAYETQMLKETQTT
jgi:hypothetical protein